MRTSAAIFAVTDDRMPLMRHMNAKLVRAAGARAQSPPPPRIAAARGGPAGPRGPTPARPRARARPPPPRGALAPGACRNAAALRDERSEGHRGLGPRRRRAAVLGLRPGQGESRVLGLILHYFIRVVDGRREQCQRHTEHQWRTQLVRWNNIGWVQHSHNQRCAFT